MFNSEIEAILTLDCHLCVAAGFKWMGPIGCKWLELDGRVG